MKYARLTKEQFDELHPEFVNFLATQTIDNSNQQNNGRSSDQNKVNPPTNQN